MGLTLMKEVIMITLLVGIFVSSIHYVYNKNLIVSLKARVKSGESVGGIIQWVESKIHKSVVFLSFYTFSLGIWFLIF